MQLLFLKHGRYVNAQEVVHKAKGLSAGRFHEQFVCILIQERNITKLTELNFQKIRLEIEQIYHQCRRKLKRHYLSGI